MADLVLDVGALADLLAQCFASDDWTKPHIRTSRFISPRNSRQINRIVWENSSYVVAASSMAFVEMVRKWDEIVDGRFGPSELATFLQDPPDWFVVEPVDEHLILLLRNVPAVSALEWPDAIHVATVLSRQEGDLVTVDEKLTDAMRLLNNG